MSEPDKLKEIKATLRYWDAMYAQHGLAPLPAAVAAQEAARHVNRVQIDWLIEEVERLREALERIADDGVEGYESPQKRVALEALRDQTQAAPAD